MTRVEWTRRSPDDIEAAIGMLLCSRSPNAVRVRPSQGDGGIDIFIPGAGGGGQERAVWQVKRYSENLTSTQKRAIKRSFTRAVEAAESQGWRITEWHLIMPLDLTNQNLAWLDDFIGDRDFPCETHGLLLCDTLAADYPNVIDYYLREGRERLQAHLDNLTNVLSGRKNRASGEPLVAADVYSDLTSIYKALNACDPFYKYSYQVSDEPPAPQHLPGEENLVAAHAICQDSVWITVKVFARMLAAQDERPTTWRLQFSLPEDNVELREQFERFVDYGAPITMPPGTVSGSLNLPGGLGGDVEGASLQVLAAPEPAQSEQDEILVGIIAPDSEAVLASTRMRRIELSAGQVGVRSVLKDHANLFTLELLFDDGSLDGRMTLGVEFSLKGRRPAELAEGLSVLANWHTPNRIAFGRAYGPPDYGVVATIPTDPSVDRQRWAPICEALARIQDHTPVQLRLPAQMERDQAFGILDAAKMLSGEPTTGTVSGQGTVTHQHEREIEPELDRLCEFKVIKALQISLGDETIPVGKQAMFYRGHYVEVGDQQSTIAPTGKYVSFCYIGDLAIGSVLTRYVEAGPEANP